MVEENNQEITNSEKLNYIVENESMMLLATMKGHRASDNDEFQVARIKIKQYRKELGLI